jgi:hypothetical protein
MQVFFIENAKPYDEIITEYHENLSKKTSSLVKEIIEGIAKSKEELIVMQKKIIVDIILQTALGSPSNPEVCISSTYFSYFLCPEINKKVIYYCWCCWFCCRL